jgi:CheY-like chemotaxis protein
LVPDAQPSRPYRVLVVDHDGDTVDMVAAMLGGSYQTIGAVGASAALQLMEDERLDAALVDQRLRDGTGSAVLAQCAERNPLCRRVAMSSESELGDLLAAINIARVSRFLIKPFSQGRLLATLAEVMAEYEAERAALREQLLALGAEAGERHRVTERRGGRRARGRGRPPHWPPTHCIRPLSYEDPAALLGLFDPEVSIAVASLRPERVLRFEEMEAWSAELELRLVTNVRDSDQALRMPDGRFALVFARTSRDGCQRACRRLAEGLPGGLLFEIIAWPGRSTWDPVAVADHILRG